MSFAEEINDLNALRRYLDQIPDKAIHLGGRVLLAFVVFLIGVQIIRFLRNIIKKALRRSHAEKGLIQFLDSLVKAGLYLVLLATIARGFGLDATSIAALIGTAGVAFGLAMQGSLSNLAGGVLIILLKPFVVGDYIKEDLRGNEGTVSEIGLIYTKLKTADNKVIVLPNGTLANNSMTNVTASSERRLDIRLTVSADVDVAATKNIILDVLKAEGAVIKEREHLVFIDDLVSDRVSFVARCWIPTISYSTVKHRLTENIKIAIDDAEVGV
ncbi:MAG: mechanosensitive ion channel [Lachnospiraceae bacterium]|nr:mechanosensitive ion channel [Lachnospiraceae bacterium]